MEVGNAAPSHLVLWDVDHTLIRTGGIGREAFAEAFERVTGSSMVEMTDPSGRTEGDIFRQTATAHGITEPESFFPAFSRYLAEAYESRLEALQTHGRALAGAPAALKALEDNPDVVQGVLTGNLRDVARIKLAAFDLDTHVDWRISAFAEDGSERRELVEAARKRALNSVGRPFLGSRTILIGDTVNDVDAAIQASATVVAVASGRFTVADLRAAGAEVVLTDLEEPHFSAALSSLLARN
jgi:phosphoglycolate phosphatase-like HAD superfamily hydrolase